MTTQTFRVSGMTCGNCVRHVNETLAGLPGAANIRVDLASGTATVSSTVDPAAVIASLTQAGYPAVLSAEATAATPPARRGCCCS